MFQETQATIASISRRRLVYGIGINDASYIVRPVYPAKQMCPYYTVWSNMLSRCYSSTRKDPAYLGCTVSKDWLTFSIFKEWMLSQDWEGNHLDKDIIEPSNKIYSSTTCCFVTPTINYLLIGKQRKRDLPMGVYTKGNKYTAACSLNNKKVYLGLFTTVVEAEKAYKTYKAKKLESILPSITNIPVRTGLTRHIKLLLA